MLRMLIKNPSDILKYFYFPRKLGWHAMKFVSLGDNLHDILVLFLG